MFAINPCTPDVYSVLVQKAATGGLFAMLRAFTVPPNHHGYQLGPFQAGADLEKLDMSPADAESFLQKQLAVIDRSPLFTHVDSLTVCWYASCVSVLVAIICASIPGGGFSPPFPILNARVCVVAPSSLMMRRIVCSCVNTPQLSRLDICSWQLWFPPWPRCLLRGMLFFGHCQPLVVFLSRRWSSLSPSAFVSVGIATSLVVLMWWTCQTSCFRTVSIWICLTRSPIILVICLMMNWLKFPRWMAWLGTPLSWWSGIHCVKIHPMVCLIWSPIALVPVSLLDCLGTHVG